MLHILPMFSRVCEYQKSATTLERMAADRLQGIYAKQLKWKFLAETAEISEATIIS